MAIMRGRAMFGEMCNYTKTKSYKYGRNSWKVILKREFQRNSEILAQTVY